MYNILSKLDHIENMLQTRTYRSSRGYVLVQVKFEKRQPIHVKFGEGETMQIFKQRLADTINHPIDKIKIKVNASPKTTFDNQVNIDFFKFDYFENQKQPLVTVTLQ